MPEHRRRRITTIPDEEIMAVYHQEPKLSQRDMSGQLNVSEAALGRWIRKHHLDPRPHTGAKPKATDAEILAAYNERPMKSRRDMAGSVGLSTGEFIRRLRRIIKNPEKGIGGRTILSDADIQAGRDAGETQETIGRRGSRPVTRQAGSQRERKAGKPRRP